MVGGSSHLLAAPRRGFLYCEIRASAFFPAGSFGVVFCPLRLGLEAGASWLVDGFFVELAVGGHRNLYPLDHRAPWCNLGVREGFLMWWLVEQWLAECGVCDFLFVGHSGLWSASGRLVPRLWVSLLLLWVTSF